METIQNQIEKLEQELAKLKEIVNKPNTYKRWRAEKGEDYCFIDVNEVFSNTEGNDNTDNRLYNFGNYYKTGAEAQKVLDKQLAIIKVNDRIRELNEGWEPDNNDNNKSKFNICYNSYDKIYTGISYYFYNNNSFLLYIKSQETAKQIINEMKDELNIIFDINN